jgi:hypothetical protein
MRHVEARGFILNINLSFLYCLAYFAILAVICPRFFAVEPFRAFFVRVHVKKILTVLFRYQSLHQPRPAPAGVNSRKLLYYNIYI